MVLPCDSKFKLLQKQIVSGVMTAICTSTKEEADSVYQASFLYFLFDICNSSMYLVC